VTTNSNVHAAHEQYLAGEYEAAKESLATSEAYASSYIVRAEVLLAMGEIDEALAAVKQGLELCPNSPRGILLRESIGRLQSPRKSPTLSDLFDDELPVIESAAIPMAARLEDTTDPPEQPSVLTEDDAPGLISETLAKLMVKQGKFAEARKVYIQLSRKYPERYDYFRRQMDELSREQATTR
jgi:tetratricopeptide (TPR) repeat protein